MKRAISPEPQIHKSTRHSKLTGDFAESLVLYWLSKHGFECALVDHTGIDIIARDPRTEDSNVMGISVKSRSRAIGTESSHLAIKKADIEKAARACAAFGCTPYFALVVDAANVLRVFIISSRRLLQIYPSIRGGQKVVAWQMTQNAVERYEADEEIISFELRSRTTRWWPEPT